MVAYTYRLPGIYAIFYHIGTIVNCLRDSGAAYPRVCCGGGGGGGGGGGREIATQPGLYHNITN